jgi:hypothetical protein
MSGYALFMIMVCLYEVCICLCSCGTMVCFWTYYVCDELRSNSYIIDMCAMILWTSKFICYWHCWDDLVKPKIDMFLWVWCPVLQHRGRVPYLTSYGTAGFVSVTKNP